MCLKYECALCKAMLFFPSVPAISEHIARTKAVVDG